MVMVPSDLWTGLYLTVQYLGLRGSLWPADHHRVVPVEVECSNMQQQRRTEEMGDSQVIVPGTAFIVYISYG